jgi:hypothetical protein
VVVADPLPTPVTVTVPVSTPEKQPQPAPGSLLSNLKLPVKQGGADPDKKGSDAPAPIAVTNIPLHDSKINPPAKKQQPDVQLPKETKGSDKTPIKIAQPVIKEERCPICNK